MSEQTLAVRVVSSDRRKIAFLAFAWLVTGYVLVPYLASSYVLEAILLPFLSLSLAALGLNILTGYCGQLSLGSAAFMAVGAFAAYNINLRLPGVPLLGSILLGGLCAAGIGVVFGLPSLRLRGFYLAVSTLAVQFFVQWVLTHFPWFSNGNPSGVISAPSLTVGPYTFDSVQGRFVFAFTIVSALTLLTTRLVASPIGSDFIAVRDNEMAARVIGVRVLHTKLFAFALSSFVIGVAGALWAFTYLRTVEPAGFNLDRSFQILFIIIIGGLASIRGAFVGAAFMVVFPLMLSRASSLLLGTLIDSGTLEMAERMIIGMLIIVLLIKEPDGLDKLVRQLSRSRSEV
ncbi:branched-chain amino acid ABC transporter permease [Paraburkholderia sp. CNPSo 3155]|nr:branched-chain amino acid ABC transporter permease [Paraburkholderia atlantica]MPW08218.1 branched-chain amino acid ABC transporter permease [Paraburkholderia atlantica]